MSEWVVVSGCPVSYCKSHKARFRHFHTFPGSCLLLLVSRDLESKNSRKVRQKLGNAVKDQLTFCWWLYITLLCLLEKPAEEIIQVLGHKNGSIPPFRGLTRWHNICSYLLTHLSKSFHSFSGTCTLSWKEFNIFFRHFKTLCFSVIFRRQSQTSFLGSTQPTKSKLIQFFSFKHEHLRNVLQNPNIYLFFWLLQTMELWLNEDLVECQCHFPRNFFSNPLCQQICK